MNKIFRKMTNSKTGAAWTAWVGFVDYQIYQDQMMKTVLNKILHSSLAKGFDGWTRYVAVINEEWDQMEVVIKRLTNGRLLAGLRAWTSNVANMKRRKVLLVKVISRIFRVQLWKGFGKWRSNTRAADQIDMGLQMQRRSMNKIFRKMANSKTGAAWSAWVGFVDYQIYEYRMMKTVLNKILHSSLTKGFDGWRGFVGDCARQERHMKVVMKKLTNGNLAAGLRAWSSAVVTLKLEEDLLVKVCCRMFKAQLWKSFGKWRANIIAAERQFAKFQRDKAVMQTIMQKLKNCKMSKAWTSWVVFVDLQVLGERLMKRTLQRISRCAFWKGFNKWHEVVKSLKNDRKVLNKVVLRIRNAFIMKGFRTWIEFSAQQRIQQERMKRVAGRLGKGLLWCAFSQWTSVLHHFDKEERFILKVVTRMTSAFVASAWRQWVESNHYQKTQEKLMKRIMFRITRGMLWKGFAKWVAIGKFLKIEETKRAIKERFIRKMVGKMKNGLLSCAWRSWMMATFASNQDDPLANISNFINILVRRAKTVEKGQLSGGFLAWKQKTIDFDTDMRTRQTQALAFFETSIAKMAHASLHAYFHRWHIESVNSRMEGTSFDMIVSDSGQLMQMFEDQPDLLKKLVNTETMGAAFCKDTNLLAKVLRSNTSLCCPECEAATSAEFINKNGFEYPVEWQAASNIIKRVDDMVPTTAVSFMMEVSSSPNDTLRVIIS
jgi:hypothetical protein